MAGLLGGPQVLHKFSYGLQYKDIPLSKHTSQGLVISSRGNQRKVLFSRDRNLPDPDKLPADTKATVEQEAATRIGLDDAKHAAGPIDVEVAQGEANKAPHLEIVVGDQGKAELAWTYVLRAKDRKDRFAAVLGRRAGRRPRPCQGRPRLPELLPSAFDNSRTWRDQGHDHRQHLRIQEVAPGPA